MNLGKNKGQIIGKPHRGG